MAAYEDVARLELQRWQQDMLREPALWDRAARGLQARLNSYIPERVHETVTSVIKQMTRAVITGSHYTAPVPLREGTLADREARVAQKIDVYRRTAAAEGGITGAGGFLMGLADFPLLLGIKFKLLFDIATLFGHTGEDYRERLYILHIFQLAFSSRQHRSQTYLAIADWERTSRALPSSLDDFDWRTFQQQYRDYIDLAKLAQLVPIIGAPVGAVVNYRLIDRLGQTAINAYRLRWFAGGGDRPHTEEAELSTAGKTTVKQAELPSASKPNGRPE
jgi:EcsC family protein